MFGSNTTSSFNFGGGSSNNSTNSGSGGLFGNSNNNNNNNSNPIGQNKPGIFGNSQTNNSGSTGLFGNQSNQNQNQGGLFGNNSNTSNATPSGGLFGNNNQASALSFGNNSNNVNNNNNNTANTGSGGLFGNSGTNPTTAPSGGLFGNKPNTSGGLFGNSNTTSNNNTSGLFGNRPTIGQGTGTGSFGNNTINISNRPTLDNDPYGMSKFSATTVKVGELMPSITAGPGQSDHKASISQASIKRKRSSTIGSSFGSPYANNNTIIKNLTNQLKLRHVYAGNTEDVSGIFSPARHSLVEKFVPPTTTVGSIKSGKNFKEILSSSKLTEIKKLINKKKNGTQALLQDKNTDVTQDSIPKRRKIVNGDGLIADATLENILLENEDVKSSKLEHIPEVKEEAPAQNENSDIAESKENPDGYWCLPTIEDLSKLSYDHLSNVEDFTIGRVGFGQIAFNYSVDLTDFKDSLAEELFGGVVKIKDKTVQVYPLSYAKPEVGMGLNVPATITLENLAPLDPESKTPIVNPSRPEVKNHVKKLKSLKGMQFISYDPIVGTWIFQVGHFSIWGLVDSDNEEDLKAWEKTQNEETTNEQRRLKENKDDVSSNYSVEELTKFHPKTVKAPKPYGTRSLIEDTFVYKMQKNNDSKPTPVIPGGWSFAPISNPDTSAASLVHKRSEFRPETPEIDSDVEDQQQFGDMLEPESPPMDENEIEVEIGSDIVDEKAYEPEIDDIDLAALEISSKFATSNDWLEQLNLASDDVSAFNTNSYHQAKEKAMTISDVDEYLFKDFKSQILENERITEELRLQGKTFANFSLNGTLVKKTKQIDTKNLTGVVEVSIREKLENKTVIQDVIQKLLLSSTIIKRSNGFPQVLPNRNLSFELLLSGFRDKGSSDEKTFWDLCSRLFDNSRIPNYDNYSSRPKLVELKRKDLVSSWLKKATATEIKQLLMKNQMDPLETIFIHILSNDLVKAAEVAIETNNNHLAVLISLLGSNDSHVTTSSQSQLQEWKRTNALRFIPKSVLKIYILLAEWSLVNNDLKIDLTEGLSWKLSFSLLLNFTDKSVNDSIREFTKLPYELNDDIYINVLKLYTYQFDIVSYDISDILDKFKSPNTQVQWFLYELLVRSTSKLSSEDAIIGDSLTLSFAEQLEQQDMYLESLFILSHLTSDNAIKQQFYSLVTRHIFEIIPDLSDVSLKQRLIQTLHVPRSLISELISLRYRYVEDYWNEVEALIDARFWNDASLSIVKFIAPRVVIGGDESRLSELDALINRITVQNLDEWNSGVGIYSNYIKLLKIHKQSVKSEEIIRVLQYLLDNLPSLNQLDNSKITKIASTLMSKTIGDIVLEVNSKFIQVDKILLLPMGESESNYFRYKISNNDEDKDVILD